MAINSSGTYRHDTPTLVVDVDGLAFSIECAMTSGGIIAEENTVTHPRTGCAAPRDEAVDATYTCEVEFMHGYGADGIYDLMSSIEGTNVKYTYQTGDVVSEDFPSFEFTGQVPFLSPLPQTAISEFATDSFTIRCDEKPVKSTGAAVTAKKASKS